MVIAWVAWIGILIGIVLAFWWLWRFAERIEVAEQEEIRWRDYIEYLSSINDQDGVWYWQQEYDARFLGGRK